MRSKYVNELHADIRFIAHGECDAVDELCEQCEERTCNASLYLTDQDGEQDLRYTCDSLACINAVIDNTHRGDNTPHVEIQGVSKPVAISDDGDVLIAA